MTTRRFFRRPGTSPSMSRVPRIRSVALSNRNVALSNRRVSMVTYVVETDNDTRKTDSPETLELAEEKANRNETPIQTWRRVARLVRIFCAVCIALRKYAMDAGLMENYLVSVTTRKSTADGADANDLEELTFCLKDFQVKRELRVPEAIITVLEKTPEQRTDDDVHAVSRLMKNLPSFKHYTHEMQLLMSKIVRYQKCQKRRVVLRKGHIGYSVYFIYSGAVTVTLDTDDNNTYVEGENMYLRKGACFGEIALVRDTRRNATVVCAEECEFLVVDKDDFVDNGLHIRTEEEFSHRLEFFRSWPPLAGVPDDVINHMTYISRTEDFSHNKVIIKDSRLNDWLWFVIKGSCEVLRPVDLKNSPNYDRIVNLHNCSTSATARTRVQSAPHRMMTSRPTSSSYTTASSRPQTSLGINRDNSPGVASGGRSARLESSRDQPRKSPDSQRVGFPAELNNGKPQSSDSVPGDVLAGGRKRRLREDGNIYVRVDLLRDGQCFGLEGLLDGYNPNDYPLYSMVSKGCTVIHLSRNKLKEMLDPQILNRVEPFVKTYPSDVNLCERFLSKSEWDHYKHNLIENVVIERQTKTTYVNSVKNCQQPEYNSRFETDYMTSQFYMPLTSRACAPTIGSFTVSRQDLSKMTSGRLRSAIVDRRPKTASPKSPVIDTDTILLKESARFGRTTDRSPISSPVGKHKLAAGRLKQYTSVKSRSSSAKPRVTLPPETRSHLPVTAPDREKAPIPILVVSDESANQMTDSKLPRRKSSGNHVVIVNTKPRSLGTDSEKCPILIQPPNC